MLLPLLSAVFVLLALVFLAAWFLFRKAFFRPRCRDLSDETVLLHSEYFSYAAIFRPALKWFAGQNWQERTVLAKDGTELRGIWLPRKNSRATLLLFHGFGGGPQDMAMLAHWGYKKGYSIFAAYERAHGKSGGHYTSMGILEASDCAEWVKAFHALCGTAQKLILCGKGIGASAVLLALNEGIETLLAGVICDSPIPDVRKLMKSVIRNQLHMQVFPLLQLLCLYGKSVWGKNPSDAVLENTIAGKHTVPVFFAAGKQSHLLPWEDIQGAANAYSGFKQLFCCEHAGHCAAELADSEGFFRSVESFFQDNGVLG